MSMLHRLTSLERKLEKVKDRCQEIITIEKPDDYDQVQAELAGEILAILDIG